MKLITKRGLFWNKSINIPSSDIDSVLVHNSSSSSLYQATVHLKDNNMELGFIKAKGASRISTTSIVFSELTSTGPDDWFST